MNEFNLNKDLNITFAKVLTNSQVIVNFIDDFNYMMQYSTIADYNVLEKESNIIFENGQGLLLDQHNMKYFPHLTPSNTGLDNPMAILEKIGYKGAVRTWFVTRTYMTRHGVGIFKTECHKSDINKNIVDMTNVPNPFQDSLRYGKLDYEELRARINQHILKFGTNNIIPFADVCLTHTNEFFEAQKLPERFKPALINNGLTRENAIET